MSSDRLGNGISLSMPETSTILAQWNYPPKLWRDFVEFESRVYRKSVRSAEHFIYGTILAAAFLMALIVVSAYLVTGKWNSGVIGPLFGIAVIASAMILIGVAVWYSRRAKIARFEKGPGKATIALNELNLGGVSFIWNYDSSNWRFLSGERKSVNVDQLQKIVIIELRFAACFPARHSPIWDFCEWRLPVESGKEAEADAILDRMRAELSVAEDAWKKGTGSLGHQFTEGVCAACDSPIHQVIMHPWSCSA